MIKPDILEAYRRDPAKFIRDFMGAPYPWQNGFVDRLLKDSITDAVEITKIKIKIVKR